MELKMIIMIEMIVMDDGLPETDYGLGEDCQDVRQERSRHSQQSKQRQRSEDLARCELLSSTHVDGKRPKKEK